MPKAFISGCYDLLHSGHVALFQAAAQYGDLYVALGSDKTIFALKNRATVYPEQERLYLVQAIRHVHKAFVSQGSGMLDFEQELREIWPDYFVVCDDGDRPEKRALCAELNIEYVVLPRVPFGSLPTRSSTALRQTLMPFRIDLCGGWLDQPFVSQQHPGSVLTISLEPTHNFNNRSGMASSTRAHALELWGPHLPRGDPHLLARALFAFDNPPGTVNISGAQDTIGLVFPGLVRSQFAGRYWPEAIEASPDPAVLDFLEASLHLLPLSPRLPDFDVMAGRQIDAPRARVLAEAADDCWAALHRKDIAQLGSAVRRGFEAQVAMFPNMLCPELQLMIDQHRTARGWKVSGAGGGGYLILVHDQEVPGALRIKIRRQ